MPPEPNSHAVAARVAYSRILAGEDAITVLIELMEEGVKLGRQLERQEREREPFDADEKTPTCDLWSQHQGPLPTPPPSQRPTVVPRPPPPVGTWEQGKRTPTLRGKR